MRSMLETMNDMFHTSNHHKGLEELDGPLELQQEQESHKSRG